MQESMLGSSVSKTLFADSRNEKSIGMSLLLFVRDHYSSQDAVSLYFMRFELYEASSREYDPGCSSRITDPGSWVFFHPGSTGQKSTGSLIRNIALYLRQQENFILYLPYCHISYLNNSFVFLWSSISLTIFRRKSIEIC
jgi:hypothetical protein